MRVRVICRGAIVLDAALHALILLGCPEVQFVPGRWGETMMEVQTELGTTREPWPEDDE